MFISRLISSIVILSFVGLTIFVFSNWFFCLLVMLMIAAGLFEFYSMLEKKGVLAYKYFGILLGTAIPLSIYLDFRLTSGWEFLFITAACLIIFVMQLTRGDTHQAVLSVSTTIFGILYISWFFSFVIRLKLFPGGAGLVAFLVLVTKASDMGAYIFGSLFGRHALIHRISPKKTWEGALSGFFSSIIIAYLCSGLVPQIPYSHILYLGAFLGVIGQIGDLYESLLKRDCQAKDAGRIFPGLGGMLDIIDSIIFTAPIFYFYIKYIL